MIRFYGYEKCSTCRKAKVLLSKRGVSFEEIDITKTPPPKSLLQSILAMGTYRLPELFNRSGQLYRKMRMSERLKTMRETESLELLATHGKLLKRPVITDGKRATVGFDEERLVREWATGAQALSPRRRSNASTFGGRRS